MSIENVLDFPSPGEIRLKGYGGEIIDFTVAKQLTDPDTWRLFVDQFRVRRDSANSGWRGEYWGKMMRGASLTYMATKNEKLYSVLADSVRDLLTTQDSDGRITSYTKEKEFISWDMWSRKYVMLGLIYFLDISKNKELSSRIIKALRRQADYIVTHIGDGEGKKSIFDTSHVIGALNSCSILEPFVKLYKLTGDASYFDFATYIVNTGFLKDANLIDLCLKKEKYPYQFPVTKAYEMMSCFEGLIEYYTVTKDESQLRAAENFVDMLTKTDYTIVGGSGCRHEFLDNSSKMQTEPPTQEVMQETCVTVTFIKLCAKLLALTGNAKYAACIERSGLNALYGAVNNELQAMDRTLMRTWREGGQVVLIEDHPAFPFDSYSPLYKDRRALRTGGMQLLDNKRSYGCCVCIGSAGTAIMGLFAIMKGEKGIFINLYNDAAFSTDSFGNTVKLTVRANPYQYRGVKIAVNGSGTELDLALRIPKWAEGLSVTVNGESVCGEEVNGYLVIHKAWCDDKIEISFKSPVRMTILNGKIAFTKGPITLSRDARLSDISSPVNMAVKDGRSVRARRVKTSDSSFNAIYEITTRNGPLPLCDYAQAGKDFASETSCLSVWQDIEK